MSRTAYPSDITDEEWAFVAQENPADERVLAAGRGTLSLDVCVQCVAVVQRSFDSDQRTLAGDRLAFGNDQWPAARSQATVVRSPSSIGAGQIAFDRRQTFAFSGSITIAPVIPPRVHASNVLAP